MTKQNQNEHPQQDLNTPSNVVANASRYNNNASRSNSTETGGNYNNRQMHEMHNSLFGGPTGDYGTDISDLLTNANNFIKQQNQQIQKLFTSCMHRGPRFTYQMQSP